MVIPVLYFSGLVERKQQQTARRLNPGRTSSTVSAAAMAKSLAELKRLPRHQLNKVNKDELIESILSSPAGDGEVALVAITDKLNAVMQEMAELKRALTSPDSFVNKKFTELQSQLDRQSEILAKQQQFLEKIDRKERENNLVILGVPDEHEALDGAVTEEGKLAKVWEKIGVTNVAGTSRRLGGRSDAGNRGGRGDAGNRRRPILLTIEDKEQRTRILENAKRLKTSGDLYSKVYIKKDVHPSVRNEWRRLRTAEATERERPENTGCVIRLDTRERKLYRDDVVIDSWNPQFF